MTMRKVKNDVGGDDSCLWERKRALLGVGAEDGGGGDGGWQWACHKPCYSARRGSATGRPWEAQLWASLLESSSWVTAWCSVGGRRGLGREDGRLGEESSEGCDGLGALVSGEQQLRVGVKHVHRAQEVG